MKERVVGDLLRSAADVDEAARRRARRMVLAAYAEREPPRQSRRRVTVATVVAAAAVAVAVPVSLSEPGDAIARWMTRVLGLGGESPRPALVRVPGGGSLLVQAQAGTWVVDGEDAKRRIGGFDGASWSPRGRFVVAWRGGELTAMEPDGRVRWSLARPDRISAARWSPVDGFRIAYLAGGALRVVNGDGTADRRLAPANDGVAPAWRPDAAHVVGYADRRNRIRVVAVDRRQELWRAPAPGLTAVTWSPSGRRLVAAAGGRLLVFDGAGRRLAVHDPGDGTSITALAWQPRSRRLAVVRRDLRSRRSSVLLVHADDPARRRTLFSGPGRFSDLVWSPDGSRLLVAWKDAGQWLFLEPAGRRSFAIANIARQFDPAGARPRFPHRVEWCCAQR